MQGDARADYGRGDQGAVLAVGNLPAERFVRAVYAARGRRRHRALFLPTAAPVTEDQPHRPYPGCYALSKVLEEVLLEQYYIQYDLNGCCLRAPWIMEKDDFKYQLSFGEDVFGGPRWRDLVGVEKANDYVKSGAVPVMLDPEGVPVKRNFIHVDDLVEVILAAIDHPNALQELFNVCMDEPVDYGELGAYLEK